MTERTIRKSFLHQLFLILFKGKLAHARDQADRLLILPKLPEPDDAEGWRNHWRTQEQPWRTEPEINTQRQAELSKCRYILPDIRYGIYPFKGMKLNRADVEWLLAMHEDGRGPVDWSDESRRERQGLDLRGADLIGVDLSGLPLARMLGGLTGGNWTNVTLEQRDLAAIHMERTYLKKVHLEGAILGRAHLEQAYLGEAHLEQAYLRAVHLEGADLGRAHLEGANLGRAHLEWAYLREAHLEGANLVEAHLEGASLRETNLEEKSIEKGDGDSSTALNATDLRGAYFDAATNLEGIKLGNRKRGFVPLADVRWGNANLTVVDWTKVKMLGDEYMARHMKKRDGSVKNKDELLNEYRAAVRANRQLVVVLRNQGLNEEAARFAYRAQVLERKVLWWQRKPLAYIFSWMLYLLAGYGYKPIRSIITYLLMIGIFAGMYFILGTMASGSYHLAWYEALVVSLTAFHGRGFFAEQFKPGDPQAFVAATEAVVGLFIEISFIATFTHRFFGK